MSAPGRALAGMGNQIAALGAKMQAEQEESDLFQTKLALTEFSGAQEIAQREWDSNVAGDGRAHTVGRVASFDDAAGKVMQAIPQNQKAQQLAQLQLSRMRARYTEQSFATQQGHRETFFAQETGNALTKTILPTITKDVESAEAGLKAADQMIASAPGLSLGVRAKLKQQAVKSVYETWLSKAGVEAEAQADELLRRWQARSGEGAAAQQQEPRNIFLDRTPSPQERAAIRRKGGIVVNLDTNWAKGDRQTSPMVVIPDDASPAERKAAEAYAARIADVYKAQFGKSLPPQVVTRSQNGRGRGFTIHTEPYSVNDSRAVEFFNSPEGRRQHAQILTETFGGLPRAHFSLPHDPYNKKDMGAVGAKGSEVDFARGVLETMRGGGGAPATMSDEFVSLIQRNMPRIRKFAAEQERALAREEENQAKENRRALEREGEELLYNNKLSREWVDQNGAMLSNEAFRRFSGIVNPRVRTTDPETYHHLMERVDEDPDRVIKEAGEAYGAGRLDHDTYRTVVRRARKYAGEEQREPSYVRDERKVLKNALKDAAKTPEEKRAVADRLREFDDAVEENKDKLDRNSAKQLGEQLLEKHRKARVVETKAQLPVPRFAGGLEKDGIQLEDVDEMTRRLVTALQAGQITQAEAAKEAALLRQWMTTLQREAVAKGGKPTAAAKPTQSKPKAPDKAKSPIAGDDQRNMEASP